VEVKWTKRASDQLASAYAYVLEDNPAAAGRQAEIVVGAVERLSDFPEIGRPGRVAGTRELVIQGTPYIVAYRVRGSSVRILALLHGARRWPTRF
jgi:toxin ParE1/3/4